MSKKKVTDFVNSLDCSAHYSGKSSKLYILGSNKRNVAILAKEKFPNVKFGITYNA